MVIAGRRVLIGLACCASTLVALSDIWLVWWSDNCYAVVWVAAFLGGMLLVVPAARMRAVGIFGICGAAAHTGVLLMVAKRDTRTFFGGAMVQVVAIYVWGLVLLFLLGAAIMGLCMRWWSEQGQPASEQGEKPGHCAKFDGQEAGD
jgi:membrane-bound ClpP family serine protease